MSQFLKIFKKYIINYFGKNIVMSYFNLEGTYISPLKFNFEQIKDIVMQIKEILVTF